MEHIHNRRHATSFNSGPGNGFQSGWVGQQAYTQSLEEPNTFQNLSADTGQTYRPPFDYTSNTETGSDLGPWYYGPGFRSTISHRETSNGDTSLTEVSHYDVPAYAFKDLTSPQLDHPYLCSPPGPLHASTNPFDRHAAPPTASADDYGFYCPSAFPQSDLAYTAKSFAPIPCEVPLSEDTPGAVVGPSRKRIPRRGASSPPLELPIRRKRRAEAGAGLSSTEVYPLLSTDLASGSESQGMDPNHAHLLCDWLSTCPNPDLSEEKIACLAKIFEIPPYLVRQSLNGKLKCGNPITRETKRPRTDKEDISKLIIDESNKPKAVAAAKEMRTKKLGGRCDAHRFEGKLECIKEGCTGAYSHPADFVKHLSRVDPHEFWWCPSCDRTDIIPDQMANHLRLIHRLDGSKLIRTIRDQLKVPWAPDFNDVCGFCGETFDDWDALYRMHVPLHFKGDIQPMGKREDWDQERFRPQRSFRDPQSFFTDHHDRDDNGASGGGFQRNPHIGPNSFEPGPGGTPSSSYDYSTSYTPSSYNSFRHSHSAASHPPTSKSVSKYDLHQKPLGYDFIVSCARFESHTTFEISLFPRLEPEGNAGTQTAAWKPDLLAQLLLGLFPTTSRKTASSRNRKPFSGESKCLHGEVGKAQVPVTHNSTRSKFQDHSIVPTLTRLSYPQTYLARSWNLVVGTGSRWTREDGIVGMMKDLDSMSLDCGCSSSQMPCLKNSSDDSPALSERVRQPSHWFRKEQLDTTRGFSPSQSPFAFFVVTPKGFESTLPQTNATSDGTMPSPTTNRQPGLSVES